MTTLDFMPSVVISGTANGADKLGEEWASIGNIPIERYPADWATYGKRAGYVRNAEMAEVADCLVACWDGESKGTGHMIEIAKKKGMPVHILFYKNVAARQTYRQNYRGK